MNDDMREGGLERRQNEPVRPVTIVSLSNGAKKLVWTIVAALFLQVPTWGYTLLQMHFRLGAVEEYLEETAGGADQTQESMRELRLEFREFKGSLGEWQRSMERQHENFRRSHEELRMQRQ